MDSERYIDALRFAARVHEGQRRRGSDLPYFTHLEAVAELVIEHGGGEDEAIAALLHDAIEDQGDGYESEAAPGRGREALKGDLEQRYGARVRRIVEACTDDEDFEKPPEGELGDVEAWRARKIHHIARLQAEDDVGVHRVACADKLHNARSILTDYAEQGDEIWRRFRSRTRTNQVWYFSQMAQVFRDHADRAGDLELVRLVDQLEAVVERLRTA